MGSSTKFIDFFVHDMLDYAVLNNNEKNFTKNINVVNAKHVVNEVIEIMFDKIEMKNITVKVKMIGFDEDEIKYLIKTDEKRLQ